MTSKVSDIKLSCLQILTDFAETKPDWKYTKSKSSFVKSIPKNAFVVIYAGMSSKVDFVNFQFALTAGHKLVGKADAARKINNWAVIWIAQRWLDESFNWGNCTVYDHNHPYLGEFEQLRSQGNKNYVRLEEFPEWLTRVFTLAETEIDKVFDISSEEALIKSIISKPIGFFRPTDVLLIQLMLGNPAYYDELVEFYSQPVEKIRSLTKEALNRHTASRLMDAYNQGGFPRFDFA